jgi:alpha-beta hydrolase superfamily lysophospholipase
MIARLAALLLLVALSACAPTVQQVGPPVQPPALAEEALTMPDGESLPLRRWMPADGAAPRAVILALHGFNDYSFAFEAPATAWAAQGVATYAYDQRGFGGTRQPGLWAGEDQLIADLRVAAGLVRARHPGVPLYLLGESMGGAVVLAAATSGDPPPADGLILAAPAVWGREAQGPLQTALLWLTAHTVPWMTFTGEDLDIWPTDNMDVLRQMSRDPLIIKETRADAIYGLVNMMDRGYTAAARLDMPALILYGSEEQVLPGDAVLAALRSLPEPRDKVTVAVYEKGWHMLLRDLNAQVVTDDVLAWLADPLRALPSGADQLAQSLIEGEGDSLKLEDEAVAARVTP